MHYTGHDIKHILLQYKNILFLIFYTKCLQWRQIFPVSDKRETAQIAGSAERQQNARVHLQWQISLLGYSYAANEVYRIV